MRFPVAGPLVDLRLASLLMAFLAAATDVVRDQP